MRLKLAVDDKVLYSNFREDVPYEEQDDQKGKNEEEKKAIYADETLLSLRLDDYNVPGLIVKVLKSMKKNEVCEIRTTDLERLKTNFEWPIAN